jgi:hypothetical protein
MICQSPGNIQTAPRKHKGEQCAGRDRWQKLLDRHPNHLARQSGMHAVRARPHLCADQRGGNDGGRNPEAKIHEHVAGRVGQPERLRCARRRREQPCSGKRGRAVAAKFRAARHLHANAADVANGFVQIVHGALTLHCKVNQEAHLVKRPVFRKDGSVSRTGKSLGG